MLGSSVLKRAAMAPIASGVLLFVSILLIGMTVKPMHVPAGDTGAEVTVTEFARLKEHQYPWGWIRWTINADIDPDAEMTFGVVFIKAQQQNALHLHPNSAEYLHVVEGACEHLVGSTWVKLKEGDTVRIPANVHHRARTGAEPCRAVIVYNTGRREMVEVKED
ncbi:MAG: cupin domain-containing protein [Planctomycetes bacterium]|nr:cupin domain-containing protein [Planctomycetota bacterium]